MGGASYDSCTWKDEVETVVSSGVGVVTDCAYVCTGESSCLGCIECEAGVDTIEPTSVEGYVHADPATAVVGFNGVSFYYDALD